jgi:hypothetical protein
MALTYFTAFIAAMLALPASIATYKMLQSGVANRVVVQVGGILYAFPRTFLGSARVGKEEELVPLHVHYPDLSAHGNSSGRCVRKIVLTDTACPYFTIFLIRSEDFGFYNASTSLKYATLVRDEGAYKLWTWAREDIYQWKEVDGEHTGFCMQPDSPPLPEPFGHTSCTVGGKTPAGGTYAIVFAYEWRSHMPEIARGVSDLVDGFVRDGRRLSQRR